MANEKDIDGISAKAVADSALRQRFLDYVEKEINESETGMFFVENDAWLEDDGFSPADVRAMADDLAADERTKLVMEVGEDPYITFYPDFLLYCMDERASQSLVGLAHHRNAVNEHSVSYCGSSEIRSKAHDAEVIGIESAFESALESGAVFVARAREIGADVPDRFSLISYAGNQHPSSFLEQFDIKSGVDTFLLSTRDGRSGSLLEECHGGLRADGTERITQVEFRQLSDSEAAKLTKAIENDKLDGLNVPELNALSEKIFNNLPGLQMCSALADNIRQECTARRIQVTGPGKGVIAILDCYDTDGIPLTAYFSPNGHGQYEAQNITCNFMTSIYGRSNLTRFINRAFEEGKILYVNQGKYECMKKDSLRFDEPQCSPAIENLYNIIQQSKHIVNCIPAYKQNNQSLSNKIKDVAPTTHSTSKVKTKPQIKERG